MSGFKPCAKARPVGNRHLVFVPRSNHRGFDRRIRTVQDCRHVEKGRESENIVPPENHFQLAEIGLLQICTFVHGAIIHAADFHRQSVRLRPHKQVRTETAKFARQPVAGIKRYCEGRGRNRHAYNERCSRENLAARIANEGFTYEAGKHSIWRELSRPRPSAPKGRPPLLPFPLAISRRSDCTRPIVQSTGCKSPRRNFGRLRSALPGGTQPRRKSGRHPERLHNRRPTCELRGIVCQPGSLRRCSNEDSNPSTARAGYAPRRFAPRAQWLVQAHSRCAHTQIRPSRPARRVNTGSRLRSSMRGDVEIPTAAFFAPLRLLPAWRRAPWFQTIPAAPLGPQRRGSQ